MVTISILPVETIEVEILPRLPVKSLLRFKSVCKSWNSLISSDNFIKSSFRKSIHDSRSITFISKRKYILTVNYYEFGLHTNCIGCINGLVFIENSHENFGICGFTVWNPATKQCLEIEPPPSQAKYGDYFPGFGFDSVANDYKLMHVINDAIEENPLKGYIYSCNAGSWSKITHSNFVVPGFINDLLNPVIVDGSPFWLITQNYDLHKSLLVMSFDVRQEFFRLLPDLGSSGSMTKDKLGESYKLLNFRDSLAVMFYDKKFWSGKTFDIHIFNEKRDDWSKMSFGPFKFINKVPKSPMELRFHIKCLRNGDILFSSCGIGVRKLYWVNLENYTIKSLGETGDLCIDISNNGYTYSESLVFIDGMKPFYEREDQFRFLVLEKDRGDVREKR